MNWPLRRRLLSRFANIYIRLVTRLSARDCTSGYRCWRREALAALPLDRFISDGYSFLVEMLFVGVARGAAGSPRCRSRSSSGGGRIEAVARRAGRVGDHAVAADRDAREARRADRALSAFSCYGLGTFYMSASARRKARGSERLFPGLQRQRHHREHGDSRRPGRLGADAGLRSHRRQRRQRRRDRGRSPTSSRAPIRTSASSTTRRTAATAARCRPASARRPRS